MKTELLPRAVALYGDGTGDTVKQIAETLEIHPVTLSRWFREDGIEIAQRGRAKDLSKWVDHICDQCGETFSIQQSQKRRFCSRDCTNAWQRAQVAVRCCEGCGQALTVQPGAKTMYTYRKFCSAECRTRHGGKRQKDPTKHVTFNCETCGQPTTKRLSLRNMNRFCSNVCASKHTKKVAHIGVDGILLDSKWEALFYGLMGFRKIPCERVNRESHAVVWALDRAYAPDFLVTIDGLQIAVEVKGQEDEDDQARWAAWRAQFGALVVVDRESLDYLLCTDARRMLYFWATSS